MKILVSACLLGINCKYNGQNNRNETLIKALKGHTVIPVCPEELGGLPTPRPCAEIVNGAVVNCEGVSVDAQYRQGARISLEIAMKEGADMAVLQSRSPSCGVNEIYDGTFSSKKIKGSGIFAQLLKTEGIRVIDIEDFRQTDL